jgi:chromosome partitioning protein
VAPAKPEPALEPVDEESAAAAVEVPVIADQPEDPPTPEVPPIEERESLVREAMARVSRETPTPAPPAPPVEDVSRETEPNLAAFIGEDTPIAAAAMAALRQSKAPFPKPTHPRILVVANQKGGVGKTTTTVNVAAGLAQRGLNVLVLDLDPQGNASTALGIDHTPGTPNMYDVLVQGTPLADVVQPSSTVENLRVAPATVDLAGAEIELVSVVAREGRLKRALAAYVEPYDYVFVDCPPSLGLLTVNALVAAEEIVIPIQCEFYALEGLGQLLHNVELVRSHLNDRLQVSTILLTMYDSRTKLAEQVANEVRSHFGDTVLETMIPRSVRISEAPGYGQTVLTYDPSSRGARAYLEAAREIAERGARMTAHG